MWLDFWWFYGRGVRDYGFGLVYVPLAMSLRTWSGTVLVNTGLFGMLLWPLRDVVLFGRYFGNVFGLLSEPLPRAISP